MRFPFARELFPGVAIPQDTIDDIDAKATALLSDTVDRAMRLLDQEHGLVNEHAWKKLKQMDSNLTLYRERRSGTTGLRLRSATFASRDNSLFAAPPPSFLLVGQVLCSLDDLMFGLSTATAEDQRLRSSYAPDGVVDCQLLQSLVTPTPSAPFNYRNLKWLATNTSNIPLTRPRDYVVVDEAGAIDSTGPRVGYILRHSVRLNGVEPMENGKIVRGAMSMCGVFHEVYPSVVHVYMHMTFEPRALGAVNKSIAAAAAVEYASAFTQMPHVTHMKKLTSAVHATERSYKSSPLSQETTEDCDGNPLSTSYGSNATSVASSFGYRRTMIRREEPCSLCCQLVRAPMHPEEAKEATCGLCHQLLCRQCRERKELSFVGRANRVHRSKYSFCNECLAHSNARNAVQLSVQDLVRAELEERATSSSRTTWTRTTATFYSDEWRGRASISPNNSDDWR